MPRINEYDRFPFEIRQRDPNWCIPANVEAVTKYLQPDSLVTQELIWGQFSKACTIKGWNTREIDFGKIRQVILEWPAQYSWAYPNHLDPPPDFETYVAQIKATIVEGFPQVISVPVNIDGTWRHRHMLTVVEFDDNGFNVHDTGLPSSTSSPIQLQFDRLRETLNSANTRPLDSLVIRYRP